MSSSDKANKALNLVTETIRQLITRFDKLQVGDPAAKTLTHDIAVTLHLPNTVTPPTHPTSLPNEAIHQGAAPTAPSPKMDAVAKKYDLVVPGNKHKAPEPEIDSPPPKDTQLPVTKPPCEASRAPPQEKSRPYKVLEDKVIYVKQKLQCEQAVQPASGPLTAVTGHMALKKAKAATAANRKTKAEVAPTTDDSADEDADGEDEPDPAPTTSTSEVAGPDASNKELGDGSQEPGDPGHVDNDINMEISIKNTLPAPLPIPTSPKKTNSIVLQQPSLLDILWTIEALRKKFEGMVTTVTHASKALHQEMDGRVTALKEEWNQQFSTMEAKIQEVEMKNHGNTVSIGHMANSFKMFSHTGKLGSFNHSTGPSSQSHPFGQLPAIWMLGTINAGNHDQSVSSAGIKYTMAWDLSQGPQPSSLLTPSRSPVLRSGEPVQLPSSQPTGSFPPANPFAHK
ncbi:hypothetical protein BDR06DRAFT_1070408 [Suillus hirtellus]|nr:hypothetical protein BDR06DRAFT_1070408 [Suillus hirtellus]